MAEESTNKMEQNQELNNQDINKAEEARTEEKSEQAKSPEATEPQPSPPTPPVVPGPETHEHKPEPTEPAEENAKVDIPKDADPEAGPQKSEPVQAETTPETGKLEPEANIPADVESKEADIKTSEPVKPEEKQAQAKEEEAAKTEAAPEPAYDEQFEKLRQAEAEAKTVEVEVAGRIKGGLRVNFEGLPGFLPASHFSMRRNPAEEELQSAVGNTLEVNVHELQDENGRKTVIFSRKNRIEEDFWNNINPGEKVTGTVSSIASFGVFLDLGGVEGLIHISQLSQVHVNDPNDFATKGEDMEAVVVDVDREKKRIALSRKELEESPWKNISEEFPEGTSHQGIVRRLTDFGAYVELKPGVDGLLRTSELSWTKRIKSPSDVLKPNQQINVYIMNVNEEKQTMALSLKRTLPNPWESMAEKFPVGQETSGEVTQVMPQGAIVRLGDDEVDGFMPRSKMRSIMQGKKVPYEVGDKVDVKIVDLVPEQESLILAPIVDEETLAREQARQQQRRQREAPQQKQTHSSITLLDMLSEAEKKRLMENGGNE